MSFLDCLSIGMWRKGTGQWVEIKGIETLPWQHENRVGCTWVLVLSTVFGEDGPIMRMGRWREMIERRTTAVGRSTKSLGESQCPSEAIFVLDLLFGLPSPILAPSRVIGVSLEAPGFMAVFSGHVDVHVRIRRWIWDQSDRKASCGSYVGRPASLLASPRCIF